MTYIPGTLIRSGSNLTTVDVSGSLHTAIEQNVIADLLNSSDINLSAATNYTFTGSAQTTLGIAGIQVSLLADKNCTVYVRQSPDGTNWDISDTYYYTSGSSFGITVQAVSSYVKVDVLSLLLTTTIFRLQTALCPIVETVPRSLDPQGNFKVSLQGDNYGNGPATFTPNQELNISPRYRLVGSSFGATIDSQFWLTATNVPSASYGSGSGLLEIYSGITLGQSSSLYTARRARLVSGATNKFRTHFRLGDIGTTGVRRRWGVGYGDALPLITDGAYFELSGSDFSVITNRGGTETRVRNGSFNGQLGYSASLTTNNTVYEILIANGAATFAIGGVPLHKITGTTAPWANTLNFHAFADVRTTENIAAPVSCSIRTMHIARLGQLLTQPQFFFLTSSQATNILKYGAGNLHSMIINNAANGAVIALSDSLTAITPTIFITTTPAAASIVESIDFKGLPFSTGLRLFVGSANASVTVVYE